MPIDRVDGSEGHLSHRKQLALYNFGIHVAPYDSPAVEGFRLREGLNFEAAARAEGFLGRSGYAGEDGPETWGEQVFPRYLEGTGFTSAPSSLSLWRDVESLMAFSYSGVHADALKHARHWNIRQTWPPLVLWWVKAGSRPNWQHGVDRLHHLADCGPTAEAFTFKTPFDSQGKPMVIDRAAVKAIAARNAQGQAELLTVISQLKV
jgi:hypothetical protein